MKKYLCLIISIIALAFFAPQSSASTLIITDMAERKVTVPFDPAKIVCIGPGALRLIVYLQAQDKLSGEEHYLRREL